MTFLDRIEAELYGLEEAIGDGSADNTKTEVLPILLRVIGDAIRINTRSKVVTRFVMGHSREALVAASEEAASSLMDLMSKVSFEHDWDDTAYTVSDLVVLYDETKSIALGLDRCAIGHRLPPREYRTVSLDRALETVKSKIESFLTREAVSRFLGERISIESNELWLSTFREGIMS